MVSFAAVLAAGWLTSVRATLYGLLLGAEADLAIIALALLGVSFVVSVIVMAMILRAGTFTSSKARSSQSKFKDLWRVLSELSTPPRDCDDPRHRSSGRHARHDEDAVPLCGVSGGASLGLGLLMLGLLEFLVPLDVDTLSVLLRAEARLDQDLASGAAPSLAVPLPTGETPLLDSEGGNDSPLLDGFGNAVTYQPERSGVSEPYTLRSFGPDGEWSSDDLCLYGHTRDLPIRGRLGGAAEFQQALAADRLGWDDRLKALKQVRCNGMRRLSARATFVQR